MYDQDEAADRALEMLSDRVDGQVAHSRSGKVTRFTVPLPYVQSQIQHARPVPEADVIDAIEGEGFQVIQITPSESTGRTRFDAMPADTDTFVVDRIGLTPEGQTVILVRHANRIVEFDATVAWSAQHLALTQPGDLVMTLSTHGSGEITGFRNRTLQKTAP